MHIQSWWTMENGHRLSCELKPLWGNVFAHTVFLSPCFWMSWQMYHKSLDGYFVKFACLMAALWRWPRGERKMGSTIFKPRIMSMGNHNNLSISTSCSNEVFHNTVQWKKEIVFEFGATVNGTTGILSNCTCRVSVRKVRCRLLVLSDHIERNLYCSFLILTMCPGRTGKVEDLTERWRS